MLPIAILYATREGQTRRIAEHIAETLRARGRSSEVLDVRALPVDFHLGGHAAAILAASIHLGVHEREMVDFAKKHRNELVRMPAAFLSVSMAEATAEEATATADARAEANESVEQAIARFFDDVGWAPAHVKPVAGALLYTRYGAVTRFVMKMISRRQGHPTDTSRDYEYTDWKALDHFVDELLRDLAPVEPELAPVVPEGDVAQV